jgi:hypothetical protein
MRTFSDYALATKDPYYPTWREYCIFHQREEETSILPMIEYTSVISTGSL